MRRRRDKFHANSDEWNVARLPFIDRTTLNIRTMLYVWKTLFIESYAFAKGLAHAKNIFTKRNALNFDSRQLVHWLRCVSCISHWHTKLYLWSFRFRRHTVLTHFSYPTKNICFHIENYYGLMFNVVRFASTSRFKRNKRARNETQLQGQLHIELISFYVLRKCSPLLTTLIDCCWTIIVGASWWECFATSRTHLEALADQ